MIYDSFDIIPIKLFLRIEQTNEVNLLSDENTPIKELEIIWKLIKEQHQKLDPNKKDNKVLNISKEIESLFVKHRATELSVFYLQHKKDQELIDLLKDYGYTLYLNNFDKNLEVIEKENKSLLIKINQLKNRLPKEDKNTNKTTLDEVILSYAGLTNSGFIDTNKITGTQYFALINLGNRKIKSLENK